jgi:hypothetical protein
VGTMHSVTKISKLPSTVIPRYNFAFLMPDEFIRLLSCDYTKNCVLNLLKFGIDLSANRLCWELRVNTLRVYL